MLDVVLEVAGEVFGREVRAADDFYELGGDSICAVEIAAALQARIGRDVDAVDLLDATDFGDFAGRLAAARR
ncbi:phosphopantetheine-binding protein [Nonomuraea fuscirosea]|uniref:phosphopantetheine-binding protein n=1 Tax=Nonomuraea fuscirosea TaxID=1291556 RepID=UPI003413DE11